MKEALNMKKPENKPKRKRDKVISKAGKIAVEFKEFISKGNVTDMAVGIIVGAAFTAIVKSLADDVITPFIGLLIGAIDFSSLSVTVDSVFFPDYSVTLAYGKFLQAILSFFITAVCVFFLVKTLNAFRKKKESTPPPPKPDPQLELLKEIRDLLKATAPVIPDSAPSETQSPD